MNEDDGDKRKCPLCADFVFPFETFIEICGRMVHDDCLEEEALVNEYEAEEEDARLGYSGYVLYDVSTESPRGRKKNGKMEQIR